MSILVPGTTFDPLGRQTQPRMTRWDIFCVHTMAGSFTGTDGMFHENGYGGTESHLGLRHDGFCKQWQDLEYTADANYQGNYRVVSMETQDVGGPFPSWYPNGPVPPWTDDQIDKIVEVAAWVCKRFDIPPVLVPDTKPTRRGLAYHRQGIDGNFTDGYPGRRGVGEKWSTGTGKPCPGTARIRQFIEMCIPRIQALVTGTQEDDMTPEQAKTLDRIAARLIRIEKALARNGDTLADEKDDIGERVQQTLVGVRAVAEKVGVDPADIA